MNTYTLTVEQIRGFLKITPTKDVRFYLNGVCFDFDAKKIVAIDGHILACLDMPHDTEGSGQHIVGADFLKSISTGGKITDTVVFSFGNFDQDGRKFTAGRNESTTTGHCVDGQYPDYSRVIPKELTGQFDDKTGLDYRLLHRLCAGLAGIAENKTLAPRYIPNGKSAGGVVASDTVRGVIMPMRATPTVEAVDQFGACYAPRTTAESEELAA